MYDIIFCPLCLSRGENTEDSQDHLLECKILSKPRKFEEITVLLEQKFKLRENLLKTNIRKPCEPLKVFCYTYDV